MALPPNTSLIISQKASLQFTRNQLLTSRVSYPDDDDKKKGVASLRDKRLLFSQVELMGGPFFSRGCVVKQSKPLYVMGYEQSWEAHLVTFRTVETFECLEHRNRNTRIE